MADTHEEAISMSIHLIRLARRQPTGLGVLFDTCRDRAKQIQSGLEQRRQWAPQRHEGHWPATAPGSHCGPQFQLSWLDWCNVRSELKLFCLHARHAQCFIDNEGCHRWFLLMFRMVVIRRARLCALARCLKSTNWLFYSPWQPSIRSRSPHHTNRLTDADADCQRLAQDDLESIQRCVPIARPAAAVP